MQIPDITVFSQGNGQAILSEKKVRGSHKVKLLVQEIQIKITTQWPMKSIFTLIYLFK